MRIDVGKLKAAGWLAAVVGGAALAAGVWFVRAGDAAVASKAAQFAPTSAAPAKLFPVTIRQPPGQPRVNTGLTNFHGESVTASCASCHATTTPNFDTSSGEALDQFHQGLKYAHGNLACLSCHNAKNYDTLQLASGQPVSFADSMALCAQCHGQQKKAYDRGAHGGMTGHWDLTRGPRTRNHCVQCHDPHAPAFPLVRPVLPPRDRISVRKTSAAH